MRDTDIAYSAGFFDGEGSITISMDKYLRLEVSVSQKHMPALLWFKRYIGGHIYQSEGYAAQWKLHGAKAIEFLLMIQPYLIEKASDAEEAIRIWAAKNDQQTMKAMVAERRRRRGRDVVEES